MIINTNNPCTRKATIERPQRRYIESTTHNNQLREDARGPVTSPGIVDYHDKADASVYLLKIKTSLLPTPQAQLIAGSLGIYL